MQRFIYFFVVSLFTTNLFPPLPVSSSTEKFWFCRLSLNHKVLHYGDLDESPQGEVPFEMLSDKSECPDLSPLNF